MRGAAEAERTPDQVREHYEIEKELAARLRDGSADDRKRLYGELYDEMYRRVPHHPMLVRTVSPAQREFAVSEQMRFLRRFIRADSTYMEIGAGDCALTFEVAKHVRKAIAVEVSAEIARAERGPGNFELVLSDGTSIPVPPGSVDVAYSNQLMEHLHPEDAREQLVNLNRALRPGGIYVCLTPNGLTGPHDISRGFDRVATGFHLHEYTNCELFDLFHSCGFGRILIYNSVRGHTFRVPARPLLAMERWLLRQPVERGRVLLGRPLLRKLLDNCRLAAIKEL